MIVDLLVALVGVPAFVLTIVHAVCWLDRDNPETSRLDS